MSGNPIAWLHEPTGNVFKDGECQTLIKVWQKHFAETISPEEIAADFVPLVRTDASSQAEIAKLRAALEYAAKGLDMIHNGLMDPTRPRQAVGEVCAHFLDATNNAALSGSKE